MKNNGKTAVEKVFSEKSGEDVYAGSIVEAELDYVMVNDITGPSAIEAFYQLGVEPKKETIVLIPDHFVPSKDIASATQSKKMRDFAWKHEMPNYFEVGRGGVCHQVMMEKGFATPGALIAGADSHTCTYGALGAISVGIGGTEAGVIFGTGRMWFKVPETMMFRINGELDSSVEGKDVILNLISRIGVEGGRYKCLEFRGEGVEGLGVSDRMTMANMASEAGAKCAFMAPDKKTEDYLNSRSRKTWSFIDSDSDANYDRIFDIDASELEPVVSMPGSPADVKPVSEVNDEIDQAYIGSCTNGRIEDIRRAAQVLKGKKVHPRTRLIVVPSSQQVFEDAVSEGLVKLIAEAGGYVSGPTCGACLGGYMGVLGPGERCISSTNRNFLGRMGDKDSKVYLANPSVVAASSILGRIASPREVYEIVK